MTFTSNLARADELEGKEILNAVQSVSILDRVAPTPVFVGLQ